MRTVVFNLFLYIVLAYVLSVIATYVLKQPLRDADKKNLLFDKLRWNQFYSLPSNKIDILFLGSSHAYRGFNPEIIDSMTHLNSFIVGSPSLNSRYFLLCIEKCFTYSIAQNNSA